MANDKQVKVLIHADATQAQRVFDSFAGRVVGVAGTVQNSLSGISGAANMAYGRMSALAGVVAGSAIVAGVKNQIDLMDATRKAAQAAGVSVQAYAEMAHAAKLADVDQEILTKTLAKLGVQIMKVAEGDKPLRDFFEQTLKVKVQEAGGALRETDKVLEDVAARFAEMEDGPRKTAMAVELFGERMGPKLIPFLNQGKTGIQELRQELAQLNGVMTDEQAAAAEQVNDNLTKLGVASQGLAFQIAQAVLPALTETTNAMVDSAKAGGMMREVIDFAAQVIRTAFETVVVVGANVAYIVRGIGRELGAMAAQVAALLRGDFSGFSAISEAVREDGRRARTELEAFEQRIMNPQVAPASAAAARVPVRDDAIAQRLAVSAPKSRMAEWEAQLAEQRLALQESALQEGTFREMSKAEEAAYWRQILATQKLSAEESLAVRRKVAEAGIAVHKEAFDASMASLKAESEAMREDYAARVLIAEEAYGRIAGRYGAESKEAAKAYGEILAERRKLEDQSAALASMRQQAQTRMALAEIELDRLQAEEQLQLGLIGEQQLLAIEQRLADRRLAIEREGLLARRALLDPTKDPIAYEQITQQIEEVERVHQQRLLQIQSQSRQQMARPFLELTDNMRAGFASVLASVGTQIKTIGGLVRGLVQVVAQAFIQMGAKMVAEWLMQNLVMKAIGKVTALGRIAEKAGEAGAGGVASMAAAPFPLNLTAPAFGAAMSAAAMAFAPLASAEKGFDIPGITGGLGPLVQTHQREMILPATLADTIRDMSAVYASGGGGRQGSGLAVELKAAPLKAGFWVVHQDDMIAAFKRAQRNFAVG